VKVCRKRRDIFDSACLFPRSRYALAAKILA